MAKPTLFSQLKTPLRNQNGFSLAEILVAAAALALVCGTLLQLFIVSAQVNARAKNRDHARLVVQSALEVFSLAPNPRDIEGLPPFAQTDEGFKALGAYDAEWRPADPSSESALFFVDALLWAEEEDRLPPLPASLSEDAGDPVQRTQMLTLSLTVREGRDDRGDAPLAEGSALRYFQGVAP